MNAVIALCHFCELHGPSILFCTQAFHSSPASAGNFFQEGKGSTSSQDSTGRPSRSSTPESPSATGEHPPPSKTQLCEACRSFQPGQPSFISHDHDAQICYISTQYPRHPQVFTVVRQACIRSLSCEVCPGREGPIFVGDEHNGYVLSYTFFVKDSQARGFQRWYSIIVVMMDRIFLLNSWPFLISNIRSLIDELQAKAVTVYDKEQAVAPQRAHRLTRELLSPGDFYRRRGGGSKTFRALVVLTGDTNLFRYLHMTFSWTLKAGGSRMTEKLLEGPPKEETLIDLDNEEEETEEGFIKVKTKPVGPSGDNQSVLGEEDPVVEPVLDPEVSYDDGGPTFTGLQYLRVVLGSLIFRDMAFHAITGNQVIVRCKFKSTLKSFFEVFQTILPAGCCRTIVHSPEYIDSYKCNFLGLSPDTSLPDHMKSAEFYIMLDLIIPDDTTEGMSKVIANSNDAFYGYGLVMSSSASLPDKAPTILTKIENVLDNENFTNVIIDTFLLTLREEWMSKVKLLFKFTRSERSHAAEEETDQLLKVLKAGSEDKVMLKFWMKGLSSKYKSHLLTSNLGS
ncbi:LOW QUALITY PROTEIN: folliculin-like [Amphiura filiformis]|uniref:LOW QUALITY PROTEIN: folliculin-like n=1 Tax=Amphiura filiformis TaxID=82378 RepID=UPI003B20BEAB